MPFKISINRNQKPGKLSSLLGGIICAVLSALGFYVAFWGDTISGGIPLLPEGLNTFIGRLMFGAGAFITALLALYAFSELFRKKNCYHSKSAIYLEDPVFAREDDRRCLYA